MNTQTEFRIKLLVTKICIDSKRNGVATVDDEKKLLEEVDEYAKQQAMEFDKWVRLNYTWDKWLITKTEHAYQLFLNDQQK